MLRGTHTALSSVTCFENLLEEGDFFYPFEENPIPELSPPMQYGRTNPPQSESSGVCKYRHVDSESDAMADKESVAESRQARLPVMSRSWPGALSADPQPTPYERKILGLMQTSMAIAAERKWRNDGTNTKETRADIPRSTTRGREGPASGNREPWCSWASDTRISSSIPLAGEKPWDMRMYVVKASDHEAELEEDYVWHYVGQSAQTPSPTPHGNTACHENAEESRNEKRKHK